MVTMAFLPQLTILRSRQVQVHLQVQAQVPQVTRTPSPSAPLHTSASLGHQCILGHASAHFKNTLDKANRNLR